MSMKNHEKGHRIHIPIFLKGLKFKEKVLIQFPTLNEDINAISNQCQKQFKHGTITRNMLEIMCESHKYSATASGKNTQMSI
jgi:hypothetical protein